MRKSGVVSKDVKGKDNEVYHDIISLFKIYRSVNWKMQIKINQVKQCFHTEYGTDVDEFLDSVYQAGMDINLDMEDMRVNIPVRQHRKSGRRETVCPGLRKPLMRVYSRNVLSKP